MNPINLRDGFGNEINPREGLRRSQVITPISRSSEGQHFLGFYRYTRLDPTSPATPLPSHVARRISSFSELVEAMAQERFLPDWQPNQMYEFGDVVVAIVPTGSPSPQPIGSPVRYQRTAAGTSGMVFDAAEEAIWNELGPVQYPIFSTNVMTQLFPLEFRHNTKFDLNRPLGDGLDNDGDGLIDEAGETGQNAQYPGLGPNFPEEYTGRDNF